MSARTDSPLARIDRDRTLAFTFDGRALTGHPGDTLASALVANGIGVVGRSPYLARPRGVFSAGVEEPNAVVELDLGTHNVPMARATSVELYDGLVARSLAGKGRAPRGADPARYDKAHRHVDVLVIGGGPAGLAAADAAAATGARVLLVDEQPELGGGLLHAGESVGGRPAPEWVRAVAERLHAAPEATVLERSTALGLFDQGYAVIAERRTEHLGPQAPAHLARQRVWHVRARRIVLATGAIERPIVFADNDRPGVMLADAVRAYVNRYAALPGRRAVVFTTNDSAYAVAGDMLDRGIEVAAVVDAREAPAAAAGLRDRGVAIHAGAGVVSSTGGERLESVRVAALDRLGDADDLSCDLLAVSGGWTPTLHLYAQAGGRLRYEPLLAAHVPDGEHPLVGVAGAAAGTGTLDACIAEGADAGRAAAGASGSGTAAAPPRPDGRALGATAAALWAVPPAAGAGWERHFVDLQRDATVADIRRAIGAGLRSLEHVKRYTTVGTGADQGKTSNVNAMGIVAELLGEDVASLAPTTYRPPYAPVPFAVLAGRERGDLHDPIRTTSIHPWHVERGAAFEDVGQWKRPWYYPAPGEDMDTAVRRECAAARGGVAVMDASTLGKIDVQGPDAAEFLDRVYTNLMSSLAVGACRYGVLCKVDGMIFDDGVVMRLAEDRFVTTTTTGGAAAVMDFLEEWLQTEWPELRVRLTSVTDHWATVAVVGPRSRDVIARLAPGVDAGAEGLPFMAIREATVAGAPARLCRVSFSGELAFEIHVPARFGSAVWTAVMDAGEEHGITPYGTEAMHVLRAEKGYVIVGQETDGTVTPQDAGMSWIVSRKKDFFIGRRSHRRPDMLREDRRQLVGLLPEDPSLRLPEGAQLIVDGPDRTRTAGHVTSSYDSGTLGRTFALALLEGGHGRMGETVRVAFGGRVAAATVTETVFYDPEGRRRDGDPAEPA